MSIDDDFDSVWNPFDANEDDELASGSARERDRFGNLVDVPVGGVREDSQEEEDGPLLNPFDMPSRTLYSATESVKASHETGWVPLAATIQNTIPNSLREIAHGASPIQLAGSFGATHFSSVAPLQFGLPTAGLQVETRSPPAVPKEDAPVVDRFAYLVDQLIERGVYAPEAAEEAGKLFQSEIYLKTVEKLIVLGVSPDVAAKQAARLMKTEKETVVSVAAPSPKKYGAY